MSVNDKLQWMTVKEAAETLRYEPQTMWRKIRRDEIPGVVKFGRSIRISRVAVFRLIADVNSQE